MSEDETVILTEEDKLKIKQKILQDPDEDVTQTDFGTNENGDSD